MSRRRYANDRVVRFAHLHRPRGNQANVPFHVNLAIQHGVGMVGHIAAAERQQPGSTGQALDFVKLAIRYLGGELPEIDTTPPEPAPTAY